MRDEHGVLQLSKNAAAFHPGQGVYRSSYKNALRLTATETNIAYRAADYDRWQQQDFVVGIHIIRSNNHTIENGKGERVPLKDICDELSRESEADKKGRYPKDFKFTGWHPFCRCFAVPILKTEKEIERDNERILNGEEPSLESMNTVNTVPEEYVAWVQYNKDRIQNARTLPYFLKDNPAYMDAAMKGEPGGGVVKVYERSYTRRERMGKRRAVRLHRT
ncbi:MAG: hypothetical protein LUC22_06105 [Prevotella sp.]|nr:hypothetical protein [Prevotella sp.]